MQKFKHVAVGGTFDQFHIGHRYIIDIALNNGHKVTVGLVVDKWLRGKTQARYIQTYNLRKKNLTDYFNSKKIIDRVTIIPLDDIYGTTLADESISAIVVTRETLTNARKINIARAERGLKRLKIIIAQMKKDQRGRIIRSEMIRKGEADRDGTVFMGLFKNKRRLLLPHKLRTTLQKPLGDVRQTLNRSLIDKLCNQPVITVGDIVTAELSKLSVVPVIAIIDNRSMRQPYIHQSLKILPNAVRVRNPSGTLTHRLAQVIRRSRDNYLLTKKSQQIVVLGEEDLATLMAVLFAPLGWVVIYGQVGVGVVTVGVTLDKKTEVMKYLKKFK